MPQLLIILQLILMNWYITKVVFSISSEESVASKKQFDEQLRLVCAESKEEAFLKARAIGLNEETSFYNDRNKRVKWEFINVAEVFPLPTLCDGTEVYSRILEMDEAKAYVQCIHQKAVAIRLDEAAAL